MSTLHMCSVELGGGGNVSEKGCWGEKLGACWGYLCDLGA